MIIAGRRFGIVSDAVPDRAIYDACNKKPTVSIRMLPASRVFPVDDSARVESPLVCRVARSLSVTYVIARSDFDHINKGRFGKGQFAEDRFGEKANQKIGS